MNDNVVLIEAFSFLSGTEVQKKIKGLRTQFSREIAKGNKKPKSGSGADDVSPASKWVHLERLRFISDHVAPKASKSNLNDKVCN